MSFHRFPICKASGKVRFGERKDVKLALRQADRNRAQALMNDVPCSRREIRAYHCSDCNGGWHLTASPERFRIVPSALPEYTRADAPAEETIWRTADSGLMGSKVA
ncbi:MAG: hypothetical protein ABI662_09770 [Dermatophilaceae bacterium]